MKVNKTDNRFKTGFPKPITGLPKKPILTSLVCRTLNVLQMCACSLFTVIALARSAFLILTVGFLALCEPMHPDLWHTTRRSRCRIRVKYGIVAGGFVWQFLIVELFEAIVVLIVATL